jgi:hypothetical protein
MRFLGESDSPRAIAMQKVVGSSPIIRSLFSSLKLADAAVA